MKRYWTDATSYSRSEHPGDRVARSWQTRIGTGAHQIRISVHRHIDYPPDTWLVSVYGLIDIDRRMLAAKDVEGAQGEALELMRTILAGLLARLDS